MLQEGDQISLIYTYDDPSTEASVFVDDASLNPETPAVESAEASMKKKHRELQQKKFMIRILRMVISPDWEVSTNCMRYFHLPARDLKHRNFMEK